MPRYDDNQNKMPTTAETEFHVTTTKLTVLLSFVLSERLPLTSRCLHAATTFPLGAAVTKITTNRQVATDDNQ